MTEVTRDSGADYIKKGGELRMLAEHRSSGLRCGDFLSECSQRMWAALGGSRGWRLKEEGGQMIPQAHSLPEASSLRPSTAELRQAIHSRLECYHRQW